MYQAWGYPNQWCSWCLSSSHKQYVQVFLSSCWCAPVQRCCLCSWIQASVLPATIALQLNFHSQSQTRWNWCAKERLKPQIGAGEHQMLYMPQIKKVVHEKTCRCCNQQVKHCYSGKKQHLALSASHLGHYLYNLAVHIPFELMGGELSSYCGCSSRCRLRKMHIIVNLVLSS